MEFQEAKAFVLKLLGTELPPNLFYHGLHHTVDVCNAVDELAVAEQVTGESLILLRTAAIFHDAGFTQQYLNNEPVAVSIAEKHLPAFNYSKEQITIICKIILSTSVPQKPGNHLEQIMCDADLDYLGREDFFRISETLKKEWLAFGIVTSEDEYNQKQVRFFGEHNYFTKTAKILREPTKQSHLAELKKRL